MALTVRENFNPSGAQFDPNNLSQRYIDLRYNLLAAVEGVKPRPYYDSEGLLSIGIGFNLTDPVVLGFVLDALGVPVDQRLTYQSIIQAGGSIATVTNALDQQLGRSFALDPTQTQNVFSLIAERKENNLINLYPSIGLMPESYERAALFSLAYNERRIGALIGPGLQRALERSNGGRC